jgi:hypothetical protein
MGTVHAHFMYTMNTCNACAVRIGDRAECGGNVAMWYVNISCKTDKGGETLGQTRVVRH